mgnify:CR=1 FL=1
MGKGTKNYLYKRKRMEKLPSFIICHFLTDLYQKRLISIPKD